MKSVQSFHQMTEISNRELNLWPGTNMTLIVSGTLNTNTTSSQNMLENNVRH